MDRSGASRAVVIASVVLVLACAGVVAWLLVRQPGGQNGQPPGEDGPKVADPVQLIEEKNVALGRLENNQPAEAIPAFEEITEQVPDDPLGPRNLFVSSLLSLKQIDRTRDAEKFASAAGRAEAALEKLRKVEGESATVDVLTARLAIEREQPAKAIEHLAAASKRQPDEAWIWYELSQLALQSDDPQARATGRESLERAFQLQPNNLFLLVNWMRLEAARIRERVDELRRAGVTDRGAVNEKLGGEFKELAARLEEARSTIQPFVYTIKESTRFDPLEMLDTAIAAAKGGDWNTVSARLSMLANILSPQMKGDESRVSLHPLEFVLLDFRPEFYEANTIEHVEAEPIPVEFVAAPADSQPGAGMEPPLANVAQVEIADFDLDGRPDLFVLAGDTLQVLGRSAGDQLWKLIAEAEVSVMTGLLVADLDLDFDESEAAVGRPDPEAVKNGTAPPCVSADVDVVTYGPGGVRVFQNKFDAQSRQRVLVEAAETGLGDVGEVIAAALLDLEADGDLDLALATATGIALWSNRGNLTFLNISDRSQLPPAEFRPRALLAVDWDRDVDLDLVAGGDGGVGFLENLRHGRFRWRPLEDDFKAPQSVGALALVDADANGSWDLLAAGPEGISLIRTRTPNRGTVRALATDRVSEFAARSLATFDYDNDGRLDVLATGERGVQMLRGKDAGAFESVSDVLKGAPEPAHSAVSGDLDRDGDVELVLAGADDVLLLNNDGGNKNRWIDIALLGQQIKGADPSASGRVTAAGIGGLLELKSGARYQARVVSAQTTHFGLGGREQADVLRVLWLNGIPQNVIEPKANQFLCEQQILHTSCPYLYTWDGEKFVFVTDLLWASPLGLQASEGELLPFRDWEYIKVPGQKLVAKDGQYVLQVTEELWEATYFDAMKLIAVDHPADVAVYSNEKVGPAEIAEFRIHTVRTPRVPVSAVNHRGRDTLPEIAERDGVYLKAFDRKFRQGLVEEHFLEVDLGRLENPRSVTLFLTGWVYPAAVSTNVALTQNPEMPLPKPPSLWVPDGKGGWNEALPYMGFPGGKTKTIAVDLSGLLTEGDYRVRIATSMELYWDDVFFTADEAPADATTTELTLLGADLHARGYSRVIPDPENGPERFLYNEASTESKWPPMEGRFTRFGDVTDLIRRSDDRLVVTGAGDEMTVRFAVPEKPLPKGWTRDFLLYSVGWDKDCNLCTILGQTVEPLPFRAMSAYPWPPDEKTPDSPEYREYLRTYQTREQGPEFWSVIREQVPRTLPRE